MTSIRKRTLMTLALAGLAGAPALAQKTGPLTVGSSAPDFALAGATQEGAIKSPVHLHDFKDQVVVIAFFYQARTKG